MCLCSSLGDTDCSDNAHGRSRIDNIEFCELKIGHQLTGSERVHIRPELA